MYTVKRDGSRVEYQDTLEHVTLRVGAEQFAGLVTMTEPPAVTAREAYEEAMRRPIGTRPLAELAGQAGRACVIVPDSTRNAPSGRLLPVILDEMLHGGLRPQDITVVVAIGVHRAATGRELDEIIGPFRGRIHIVNHDPYTREALVSLGQTARGTPIEVSRLVYECDLRVGLAKVEPHEFAGFSGGRKLALPGVSSEVSIVTNHRPEMILDPRAYIGVLDGNPVSEDMEEAASRLGLNFVVNTLVDRAGEPVGVFAGDLIGAHRAAVAFLRSYAEVALDARPDVIVTTPGSPLNINLYQSLKPVFAAEPVIAEGGAIVLYSACHEGVGSEDMLKPYDGQTSPDGVIARLKQGYKIQMDHALLLSRVQKKGLKLFAASAGAPAEALKTMFIDAAGSPQEALDRAIAHVRAGARATGRPVRVLFFPQPQRTLPTIRSH
ncbi:MAG: nickel-dependent lactate racemase family protein [Bacillota bacterium]